MPSTSFLYAVSPDLREDFSMDSRGGIGSSRRWELQTAPTMEPVSVDQVRLWMRQHEASAAIRDVDDQILEQAVIPAARKRVEEYIGESLITQTWDAYFDAANLTHRLRLGRPPLSSITSIISFADDDSETTQTASTYYALAGDRCEVALHDSQTWPSSPRNYDSLRVRFVAGYGASSIGTPDFQGSGDNGAGNDELATGGTYSVGTDATLRVMCDAETSFKYSMDGGLTYRETETTITGDYQLLESGVFIKFPATSGYTATTDYWDISLTGHGVPEHYTTAIKMLAAMLYAARYGHLRQEYTDLLERGELPPIVKALLPRKIRL